MSVNYEYDFVNGLYRAKIKTTYKRSDMSMNDFIYSSPYKFRKLPPLQCQYERANAFGNNSWYDAYKNNAIIITDYNKYSSGELIVNKEASYLGFCWNNTQANYYNIKCSYQDLTTGEIINNVNIEDLINFITYNNQIHCNLETLYDGNAWSCGLAYDICNEIPKFSQVIYDNEHILHLGRPDYSISNIVYNSENKIFSMQYHEGIHADSFAIPLKKKVKILSFSYEVQQVQNPGWGAWQGTNIGFIIRRGGTE